LKNGMRLSFVFCRPADDQLHRIGVKDGP
jgi:hypothetical protein